MHIYIQKHTPCMGPGPGPGPAAVHDGSMRGCRRGPWARARAHARYVFLYVYMHMYAYVYLYIVYIMHILCIDSVCVCRCCIFSRCGSSGFAGARQFQDSDFLRPSKYHSSGRPEADWEWGSGGRSPPARCGDSPLWADYSS